MGLKLIYAFAEGDFDAGMRRMEEPIARAATAAIHEVGEIAKTLGRASIASGMNSRKWPTAWRLQVYPSGGKVSINAAAFLFHKIPYARVFEDGARISGRPMLWIPLSGVPSKIGRFRMTPANYVKMVGPLFSINRGPRPLLATRIHATSAQAGRLLGGVTVAKLRAGFKRGGGALTTVPLFVGVPTITLRSRFNTAAAAATAQSRLASLYFSNLRAD